jgi:phenylacetate-coenzyme A ligase PaaK-like adenylate-forming protein
VTGAAAAARLRDTLLRQTVAWCVANSPYYRARFPAPERFGGLDDLKQLPILRRQDVIDHHAELRCDGGVPAAIQHTTGTTGAFLELYRSAAEQAFVWEFFAAQLLARPAPSVRPLHLNLVNAYHGALTAMPSAAYVLSAGVYDRAQALQARGLLERRYDMPGVEARVSVVMGTERMVKALTAFLLDEGYDLPACPVSTVVLFGGHVTPARKLLLGQLWGAAVQDLYSLTELFGGASECGIGGPWVFDPHVIPEVVHPSSFEPVDEGVGVLLLTGLYPFMQQMPFVRYWTNDLVEVVAPAGGPAGLQVRYVGRLPRSVLTEAGEPLLLSGPLYEIIESIPDVAITARFPDLGGGTSPALELTGDHHYAVDHSVDDGADVITVTLGLRYAPWLYPDRASALEAEVTGRLLAAHPALAAGCVGGRAKLRIRLETAASVPAYDSK